MTPKQRKTPGVYVTEAAAPPSASPAPRGAWHGPSLVDGLVHLSAPDLAKLDLVQTKAELARARHRIGELERATAEAQWADAQRRFAATLKGLDDAAKLALTKLADAKNGLAAAYKFDWAAASFDDESGQVFANGEPLRGE